MHTYLYKMCIHVNFLCVPVDLFHVKSINEFLTFPLQISKIINFSVFILYILFNSGIRHLKIKIAQSQKKKKKVLLHVSD